MTFRVWVLGVMTVTLMVTFVASYVASYVRAFRREYSGPRALGTWTLIKMALRALGRKS